MLNIAQVVISIILIILILLQERSSGLSGALGSSGGSSTPYQKRRGMENFIYWGTVICSVIFVGLAVANLIL